MTRLVLLCLFLGSLAASLSAVALDNANPEFSVEIPEGFTQVANPGGKVIAAYVKDDGGIPIVLIFERYGREIHPRAADEDKLTVFGAHVVGKYNLDWGWDEVNCAITSEYVVEGMDSYNEYTHIAWIPLKGEAVVVMVSGTEQQSDQLRTIMNTVVDDLDGTPSASRFPPELWFVIGPMLLLLLGGGFFIYWRKQAPRKSTSYAPTSMPPEQPVQPQAQPPAPSKPPPGNRADLPPWEQ